MKTTKIIHTHTHAHTHIHIMHFSGCFWLSSWQVSVSLALYTQLFLIVVPPYHSSLIFCQSLSGPLRSCLLVSWTSPFSFTSEILHMSGMFFLLVLPTLSLLIPTYSLNLLYTTPDQGLVIANTLEYLKIASCLDSLLPGSPPHAARIISLKHKSNHATPLPKWLQWLHLTWNVKHNDEGLYGCLLSYPPP